MFPVKKLTVLLKLCHPTPTHTAHTALLIGPTVQLTGRLLFMNHLKRGFITDFCSQQISLLATLLQLLQNTSLKYVFFFFSFLNFRHVTDSSVLGYDFTYHLTLQYNLISKQPFIYLVHGHIFGYLFIICQYQCRESFLILYFEIKLRYMENILLVNNIMLTTHAPSFTHFSLHVHFENTAQSNQMLIPHHIFPHEILFHLDMHHVMEGKETKTLSPKKKKYQPKTKTLPRNRDPTDYT